MIFDARQALPPGPYEVVIVGAGPAGIAVARELAAAGRRVLLLEAGGLALARGAQALNAYRNVGSGVAPLHSRLRLYGGSTAWWGGNIGWLDPIDFEARPWVPGSGWPFGPEELAPWLVRALELQQVPEEARPPFPGTPPTPLAGDLVEKPFGRHPLRFGEAYRSLVEGPEAPCDLALHAVVTRLEAEAGGRAVRRARVASGGRRGELEAGAFVLAGGAENARLLLLSELGNRHDQVGRAFMLHLHLVAGLLELAPGGPDLGRFELPLPPLVDPEPRNPRRFSGLQLGAAAQRREEVLQVLAWLDPPARLAAEWRLRSGPEWARVLAESPHPAGAPGRALAQALARVPYLPHRLYRLLEPRRTPRLLALRHWAEQEPRPENRLALGAGRDALGQPALEVRWGLSELDRRSLRVGQRALAEALEELGAGRVVDLFPPEGEAWPPRLATGSHMMGGTRMSARPEEGVVDPRGRVHGLENLWVVGGSVLPTGGVCMVTPTLLALALRSADALARSLDEAGG